MDFFVWLRALSGCPTRSDDVPDRSDLDIHIRDELTVSHLISVLQVLIVCLMGIVHDRPFVMLEVWGGEELHLSQLITHEGKDIFALLNELLKLLLIQPSDHSLL